MADFRARYFIEPKDQQPRREATIAASDEDELIHKAQQGMRDDEMMVMVDIPDRSGRVKTATYGRPEAAKR